MTNVDNAAQPCFGIPSSSTDVSVHNLGHQNTSTAFRSPALTVPGVCRLALSLAFSDQSDVVLFPVLREFTAFGLHL